VKVSPLRALGWYGEGWIGSRILTDSVVNDYGEPRGVTLTVPGTTTVVICSLHWLQR